MAEQQTCLEAEDDASHCAMENFLEDLCMQQQRHDSHTTAATTSSGSRSFATAEDIRPSIPTSSEDEMAEKKRAKQIWHLTEKDGDGDSSVMSDVAAKEISKASASAATRAADDDDEGERCVGIDVGQTVTDPTTLSNNLHSHKRGSNASPPGISTNGSRSGSSQPHLSS